MIISEAEFKNNLKNIYVRLDGEDVILLTKPNIDIHKILDSLVGIISTDITLEQIKNDRLKRQ